ncbi:MAG: hypothetical protein ABJB97_06080 [Acidobacteriota bacterium]
MNEPSLSRCRSNKLAISTLIALLGVCAFCVEAQSGRRVRKPSVAAPVATPEPSPTPSAKSPEKRTVPVLLGADARGSFSNIPLYFNDSVLQSCAERLNGRPSIKVEVSSRDINRGEAVKRAKAQTEGYVVLLELRSENMSSDNRTEDLARIYLEYTVFSAGNARQIANGRTYQQVSGYKDVIVGRTSSGNSAYVERRLKEAAREAAERILAVVK